MSKKKDPALEPEEEALEQCPRCGLDWDDHEIQGQRCGLCGYPEPDQSLDLPKEDEGDIFGQEAAGL